MAKKIDVDLVTSIARQIVELEKNFEDERARLMAQLQAASVGREINSTPTPRAQGPALDSHEDLNVFGGIVSLLDGDPGKTWSARDIRASLGIPEERIKPFYSSLSRLVALRKIRRVGRAKYQAIPK